MNRLNEAIAIIAESIIKSAGTAGIEAMAIRALLRRCWDSNAEKFADDLINATIDFDAGIVRPENADAVILVNRVKLTSDFTDKVLEELDEFIDRAWENGKQFAVDSIFKNTILSQKREPVASEIIANLAMITGSSKENVKRTINRWFKNTQGQYFNRFIIPETERLLSYASTQEGNIDTLRSIGQRYKDFVQADAYWSSISEFDAETSKAFAQVQTLYEMGITTYRIEAVLDEKTCAVCEWLHGTVWSTERAMSKVAEMLVMEAEQAAEVNPFPARQDPVNIDDPQMSGYNTPPFHPRCRCNIVAEFGTLAAPISILEELPTVPLLENKLSQSIRSADDAVINNIIDNYTGGKLSGTDFVAKGIARPLTAAEMKRVKEAWNNIPYELRKWAIKEESTYSIYVRADGKTRVIGSAIEIGEKYLDPTKYNTLVIEHELRHALVNKAIIRSYEEDEIYKMFIDKKIPMPLHANSMIKINRNITSGVDEILSMMGDYYKTGISLDEFVDLLVDETYGVQVESVLGSFSTVSAQARRWTKAEARKAAKIFWEVSGIDTAQYASSKQLLATINYKPATSAIQQVAYENEVRLRDIFIKAGLKSSQLGDNEPFDVWIGGDHVKWYQNKRLIKYKPQHVIEVKTIVRGKNDKITMHGDSLARKKKELKVFGKIRTTGHTIVFDERVGKIYYKEGVGSFRISTMREVTEEELVEIFGGSIKKYKRR